MPEQRRDAPSAAVAVRRQAGVIIIIQLILGVGLLVAAIFGILYLQDIRKEAASAVELASKATMEAAAAEKARDEAASETRKLQQQAEAFRVFDAGIQALTAARLSVAANTSGKALEQSYDAITSLASAASLAPDSDQVVSAWLDAVYFSADLSGKANEPSAAWRTIGDAISAGSQSVEDKRILSAEQLRDGYIRRAEYACRMQSPAGILEDLRAAPADVAARIDFASLGASPEQRLSQPPQCAASVKRLAGAASNAGDGAETATDYAIREFFLHFASARTTPQTAMDEAGEAEIKAKDARRRELAKLVQAKLNALQVNGNRKYRVLGPQVVNASDHSVRYYHDEQRPGVDVLSKDICEAAAAVKSELAEASADDTQLLTDWATCPYKQKSLDGKYERLPPNRAEVWL